MTPRQTWEGFAKVPGYEGKDQSEEQSRTGRVGLDDLLAVVSHHTCRTVTVGVAPWGITDIPASQVQRGLKDEWFIKRCTSTLVKARAEKPGVLLEVSLSIRKLDQVKHEAYSLVIHDVLIDMDNGRAYFID